MAERILAANVTTPEVQLVPGMLAYTGDLEQIFSNLHQNGYTGVEFITTDPACMDLPELEQLLKRYALEPVGVNTGRLCGGLGLTLSSPDPEIRLAAAQRTREVIDFAAHWGLPVNVGILRGKFLPDIPRQQTYAWTVDALRQLGEYSAASGVTLVLETVHQGMTNFLNTLDEAAQLIRDVNGRGIGVMYDVYQMDIEEPDLYDSISRYISLCRHVHLSDRERKVPGDNGLDFPGILAAIHAAGYHGAYSIEIAMEPDQQTAHRRAAEYLLPLLQP